MSQRAGRPSKEEALRPLRRFQRETVSHVVDRLLDPNGSRRFLVADEVGLGKTLVARGVVAEFIDRHWDQVEQLDIIYLCSNAALARENIHKLRVGGKDAGNVIEATRFTLLPAQRGQLHARLNFISLTPGTAMRTAGAGMKDERVILYKLLRQSGREGRWLTNFLQGSVGTERWRRLVREKLPIDSGMASRFHTALAARPDLIERLTAMEAAFARVDGKAAEQARPDAYRLIGDLRNVLARVCIDAVQPDLIILDEFQRFKDLLTTKASEPSPEVELAKQLFDYRTPEGNRVALLLLSATPYRMFTTNEEVGSEEDHHRDFLQTLAFLLDSPEQSREIEAAVRVHRDALMAAASGATHDVVTARESLQSLLLKVMCRRERVGASKDRGGMLRERRLPAPVQARDIQQYLALEDVRVQLGSRDLMELWKSAPHVLNFAKDYEFKRDFLQKRGDIRLKTTRDQRSQHLDPTQVSAYEAIESGNARLRLLTDETLGQEQWRMLWLPPSMPYWPLAGAWANNAAFTKKLLFSSWNVVPDAVTALLSYEVERRSVQGSEAAPSYTEFHTKRSPLLRLALQDGKATSMTTLALQLPCLRLAAIHPLSLSPTERSDLHVAMRRQIQPLLVPLRERVKSASPDPAWYWAALLLLDGPEASSNFLQGIARTANARPEDDPEATNPSSGLAGHVARALAVLRDDAELGEMPEDLADVLVDFALGSPAVAWARTLEGFQVSAAVRRELAARMADAFRSLFNQPLAIRILQSGDGARYWRSTLQYAIDGNLQAVLDEYAHLLWEPHSWEGAAADEIARKVTDAAAAAITTKTSTVHPDYFVVNADRITAAEGAALRTHFALRYGAARSGDEAQSVREDAVRGAFKSPFYPFVLATTSVGQEGLDFHPWCHSVWHWNLPGNPVDLEQREGRVHRYKGHAVRKNVAEQHGASLLEHWRPGTDPWSTLFDIAERSRSADESELIPCWLAPGPHLVERVVPVLPLSREEAQLVRLKHNLALYRVAFGQPRQAELIELLRGADIPIQELETWVVRLEPERATLDEHKRTTSDAAE
jgi:hypothetical protein